MSTCRKEGKQIRHLGSCGAFGPSLLRLNIATHQLLGMHAGIIKGLTIYDFIDKSVVSPSP